ncbi:hypothetical protein ACSLBF_03755 [Pseudoalteromonas sp. T1lg65]|uniref:hypothetical protein n=1 Tax=Pseudoalteromonas sp. T1lg65 TaxID=2077101 RepID=UPI003F793564
MKTINITKPLLLISSLCVVNQVTASGPPPKLESAQAKNGKAESKWVYSTNGVHSDHGCNAKNNHCIAPRTAADPQDPQFPDYWISDWTMFTVLNEAASEANPPPYANPPTTLKQSDYKVSFGTSYYDSTYNKAAAEKSADKENYGAMMEYYNDFCLPIFGKTIKESETDCAFVSLGKKAYYITFDKSNNNSEQAFPEPTSCCQFSPNNHPPRTDFLKHLDYWPEASKNLNNSVQAYYWKALWSPGAEQQILFAYAFNNYKSPEGNMPRASEWYQHPQSFFFSGMINQGTAAEPDFIAPIISQNYTSFRKQQPNPELWQNVVQWCPAKKIQKCRLFPDQLKGRRK